MTLRVAKFVVQVLVRLPSGDYALYTAANGKRIWTKDLGYQVKDSVELHYSDKPEKLIINGIEKPLTQ